MPLFKITLSFLLGCALTGCQRHDTIETYQVPKEARVAPSMAPSPMAAPAANASPGEPLLPAAGAGGISWTRPDGWTEQPPSSMRVGSFLVRGSNGQTADMSIIPLSGTAGGDLANINRWRSQINLEPITEAELPRDSRLITPGGRPMRLVDIVSRDLLIENRYKKRLIAAIYLRGGQTWFFKLTGEDATVEAAEPAFLNFLQSLKFHDD